MGSSESTNVANITSNIVSNEVSNEMSKINLKTDTNQMISVVGGTGNVTIDGNTQSVKTTVNMDGVAKQMSSQSSQQSVVQKLSQAAAASTSGLNLFNSSQTDNTMNDVLNASMNVASNLAQICSTETTQNQTIQVDQRDGNIEVNNNTQTAVANVIGKCIQSAAATNKSLQEASQELAQTATSKTVGFSLMEIIILLVVVGFIILLIGGAVIAPEVVAVNQVVKVATIFMGPLMMGGGAFCIWWWSKHKGNQTKTMTAIQFSSLISNDPSCGAVPYVPIKSPNFTPGENPLNTAGALCLGDPKCVALDWDTSTDPPKVTYYSSVGAVPCPNVKTQDLQKEGIDLVSEAAFSQGGTDPTATAPTGTKWGDVYLNNATGRIFWKVQKDKTQNPWVDVTDGQTFPGWVSGATVTTGGGSTPQDSVGKDNDLYINISDPNDWEVWKRYSSKYGPLNSTDGGNLSTGPNGGTKLAVSYATTNGMSFPGRHGNTKPAQNYNWSGYTVLEDNSTYFFLILGIMLVVFGLFVTIWSIYNWSKKTPPKSASSSSPSPSQGTELTSLKKSKG